MSCGNNNGTRFNTRPFGFLRGPYHSNPIGTRFSLSAETDLLRQGYSWDEIEQFRGSFGNTNPTANAIRPSTPRQVEIETKSPLSESEQSELEYLQKQLDAKQRELELRNQKLIASGAIAPDGTVLFEGVPVINRNRVSDEIERLQDQISAIQSSRISSVSVSALDLFVNADTSGAKDNPLNCYTSVQYHISLSMLNQDAALAFQTEGASASVSQIDLNTLTAGTSFGQAVVLASTGDAETNSGGDHGAAIVPNFVGPNGMLSVDSIASGNEVAEWQISSFDRNYYNIESAVVKNVLEPSQTNPLVSTMLNMKLRIAEPHGLKFHEDIRDTAILLGYRNINPGRVLYRVDISFSGYDQDTGSWDYPIDIGHGRTTISSVMSMTKVEAEVTNSGTFYDVDMAPAGHHAYRPEDFILDADAFESGKTFRQFLTNLSASLKSAKESRTQEQLVRNYEFFAPTALLDSDFDIGEFVNENQKLFSSDDNHVISTGRDIDILTILKGALGNTIWSQEIFIADQGNDAFLTPRVHFAVRFNTIYGDTNGAVSVDPSLNDYREITHQYYIEPFVSFKHGPVNRQNISTYVSPQNQLQRIREIIRLGQLRRVYNYIYTGENTEVIDFDVKLKTFFYNTLNTSLLNGAQARQDFSASASTATSEVISANQLVTLSNSNPFFNPGSIESIIENLFGRSGDTDHQLSRTGADRLGGGFNETRDRDLYGDVTSRPNGRRNTYELYMDDYLSLDLLQLEGLKVRGDPVWLLSPYANYDIDGLERIASSGGTSGILGSGEVSAVSPGTGSVGTVGVRPRQGQIIFLKILAPSQDDHMNPDRTTGSSYSNIIGGFYQVTSVTSTFENGKFTQMINGVKLNHLNYVEDLFQTGSSDGGPLEQNEPLPVDQLNGIVNNALNEATS